jgi:tetratricopeptide (TPR) repeat protein
MEDAAAARDLGSAENPQAATPQAAAARPRSRLRQWLYRLAAVTLVPALVFGLLEMSLRLAGYGEPTDYFLDGARLQQGPMWVDNPAFGHWVFPRSLAQMPQPASFVLPKAKPTGTYRIFVIGESAAMGFPDPATSFARILEVMLRARYPDRHFEVVNTAMVAINSHVALPIARECVARQPDLLVVHLGNNEVVGPFGAAGVLGPFTPSLDLIRANLALKTLRTGQLVDRMVHAFGPTGPAPAAWDGMAMFVDGQQLRGDDARLLPIYAHFRENLADICKAGIAAHVPVVLCTIPVNLRESAPFGSLHAVDLSSEQTEAWDRHYQEGIRLEEAHRYADAVRGYEEAAKIDDSYADLAFRLARCHAALADGQARRYYLRARDLDTLRFRSDATINATIREVATDRADDGVLLADAESRFAASSPDALPGDELFLEHVHMTFKGNYLLAWTVFESVAPLLGAGAGVLLDEQQCAERLAQTEWNEWKFGTEMFDSLLQGPPFTLQLDHRERCHRWKDHMANLHARLQSGGIDKAIGRYQTAINAHDPHWMVRLNFAALLDQCRRTNEAREQYEEVLARVPRNYTANYRLGNLEVQTDPAAAEAHFRAAIRVDPSVEAHIGLAEALEQEGKSAAAVAIYEQQLRQNPGKAVVLVAIGRQYFRAGKFAEARAKFREALEREPKKAAIHVDLSVTAQAEGNDAEAIEHLEAALRLQPDWPEVQAHLAELRKRRR